MHESSSRSRRSSERLDQTSIVLAGDESRGEGLEGGVFSLSLPCFLGVLGAVVMLEGPSTLFLLLSLNTGICFHRRAVGCARIWTARGMEGKQKGIGATMEFARPQRGMDERSFELTGSVHSAPAVGGAGQPNRL